MTSSKIFGAMAMAVAGLAACGGDIGSALNPNGSAAGPTFGAGGGSASSGTGKFDPGGTGQGGGFQQCQGIENAATKIPVSMFIQIDKSGSMADNNKWGNAKNAFTTFFKDPAAQDGLNVALRFWPDGGCDPNSCSTQACSQPQVPVGPLSDASHVQQLVNLFNSKSPGGLTPMSAALAGAELWAVNQQTMAEKKEKVVVILMTDGEPTACDQNINNIAGIADKAFQQKGILTFAVGLQGSKETDMNTIAKGGHTTKAFLIGNGNAEADLLAALKKIQDSVVACTYAMPESPDATQSIDPNQVNITYTPGAGGSVDFTQVGGEGSCGSDETAWFYDDPNHPAAIILCPKTCDKVQADQKAKIKVVLGCATKAK